MFLLLRFGYIGRTMRLFTCRRCAGALLFEDANCDGCGHQLGFWPEDLVLASLEKSGAADVYAAPSLPGRVFRLCANAQHGACNWLVDVADRTSYCAACRHNRVIPALTGDDRRHAWIKIENAKHRLFYSLFSLGLMPSVLASEGRESLTFRFLADQPNAARKVMTGHSRGCITIALSEADDSERERRRKVMKEPYRTLLGHFRHEIAHFFWNRLVRDGGQLDGCRAIFGDDSQSYKESLARHYRNGSPPDWQRQFISAYASSHPLEDFAETWAHYLHIADMVELARAYRLKLGDVGEAHGDHAIDRVAIAGGSTELRAILREWATVFSALNGFNRAMGRDDFYRVNLTPTVVAKLDFIHNLIGNAASKTTSPPRRHGSLEETCVQL